MKAARRGSVLIVFWFLAWGEFSLANLVSGVAVAALLLVAFPPRRQSSHWVGFSPRAAARLGFYIVRQLVPSNLLVAREVLARSSQIRSGVLVYRLQRPSDEALNLMAHVIALTPGTMAVEAIRDPGELHVHFLLLDDVEHARASLARLDALVTATLGGERRPPVPLGDAPLHLPDDEDR